jgi:aerobic C4-dicarboxylate transport protein
METLSIPQGSRPAARQPWYSILYVQVLIAIVVGVIVGHFFPDTGKALKPLGDAFIALIRMMIAPVIFCTVVHGISSMGDLRRVGRVGIKTLFYFEVVSTFALLIGLLVGELVHPGAGFNIDPHSLDAKAVASYVTRAKEDGITAHLMAIIPDSYFGALARGDLLQILLVAILSGFAIAYMGPVGQPIVNAIDMASKVFFGVIRIIVKVAPIGAFGAMAFTVGKFGTSALVALSKLVVCTYLTEAFYVVVVLGTIAYAFGFSLFHFIRFIREEILLVIGTSSSESVLPQLMQTLPRFGASRSVVDLVLPTGYAFNLGGLAVSLPISTLFIAQVYHVELGFSQLLALVAIMLVTSKGAAGVTGAAFIVLATTVGASGILPLEGLALVFAVDSFLSMARALANVIGNGVATIVIAKLENEFDPALAGALSQA